MNKMVHMATCAALVGLPVNAMAKQQELDTLHQEIEQLKNTYETRIQELETRLKELEQQSATSQAAQPAPATTSPASQTAQNAFNPAISVILDGKLTSYSQNPDNYALPGFPLGGEAGLDTEGLSLGESELVLSGSIDDRYFGKLTTALHDHEGETEIHLEEAYVETMGLPVGWGVRAGRFFSGVGYLNSIHPHAWDFADAPLAYRAFLGQQYFDDGVQVRWLAPTDLFLEFGAEALRGARFPAGGAEGSEPGSYSLFAHLGGDVGLSHAWRVGLSHLWADPKERGGAGHDHGDGAAHSISFTGDSDLTLLDFVWKWAPDGNPRQRNLVLQAEHFWRDEEGLLTEGEDASGSYTGSQRGWYAQAVYQFMPRWRAGIRYDRLTSNNRGDNEELLEEAGLLADGLMPERYSLMLDYSRSEFSRIRLQYNRDESRPEPDDQWILQYVMSLGAHGAHEF